MVDNIILTRRCILVSPKFVARKDTDGSAISKRFTAYIYISVYEINKTNG